MSTINTDLVDVLIKATALVGAGAFFGWKLWTGWLFINLRTGLRLERAQMTAEADYLAITLELDKGSTDSIWLKHVSARVVCEPSGTSEVIDFSSEIYRLQLQDSGSIKKPVWADETTPAISIALAPGEAITLARHTVVPASFPVRVEVVIYGDRPWWRKRGFQWRASAVSLPSRVAPPKIDA